MTILRTVHFNSLWEAYYRHDSLLVFSTKRSPTSYKMLRSEKRLLTPDVSVMSVAIEIAYGEGLVVDDGWLEFLNQKWDRDVVVEETAKFPELVPQSLFKDMVSFSCCEYDGGKEEKQEMDIVRERSWRGNFRRRGGVIRPGAKSCGWQMSFNSTGGMGLDNTTLVYVAVGKIYKAEKFIASLKQMFPCLETKDTLASPEELAPFEGHLSRLVALDYTVCLHNKVFVISQGGNFPHFLMGHRRYLDGEDSKTIKLDKRKLALLFDNPKISEKCTTCFTTVTNKVLK